MEDTEMLDNGSEMKNEVTILDVLGVDLCRDAILDLVHVKDIVRSERVCRRWQRAVLDYLFHCRNLTLGVSPLSQRPRIYKQSHRIILIHDNGTFRLRNAVEKLGPFIKRLLTNRDDEEFYDSVASFCPRLRQIELKYLSMECSNITEYQLGRTFQNIELEKVKLVDWKLSGKCLEQMNLNSLKSLSLICCPAFTSRHLESKLSSLRSVTTLEIISIRDFSDMLALLYNMPKLENITYKGYFNKYKLVECCSQLDHLKRFQLIDDCYNSSTVNYENDVDDEFLEGLASSCKKLEYLNVTCNIKKAYGRGLAALVLRPSPGTYVCFANTRYEYDKRVLLEYLQPLNNELKARLRKIITQEMLNEAFKLKGLDDLLKLRVVNPVPGNANHYPELKVVLNVFLDRMSGISYIDPPYL